MSKDPIQRMKKTDPRYHRDLRWEQIPFEHLSFNIESRSAIVPDGEDWREFGHVVDYMGYMKVVDGKFEMNATCTCEWFQIKLDGPAQRTTELLECEHIKMMHPHVARMYAAYWYRKHNMDRPRHAEVIVQPLKKPKQINEKHP